MKAPSPKQAEQTKLLQSRIRELFFLGSKSIPDIVESLKEEKLSKLSDSKLHDLATKTIRDEILAGFPDGNNNRYLVRANGLYRVTGVGDAARPLRLTTFRVVSLTTIIHDDGVTQTESIRVEAKLDDNTETITLTPDEFKRMEWHMRLFNQRAVVMPKLNPEALVAIQLTVRNRKRETVNTHTGWKPIDGKRYFLHSSGAIGPDENRRDIKATLPKQLANVSLPDPVDGEAGQKAIQASLRMLELGDDAKLFPLYAAIFRAPLGKSAMNVFVSGQTGVFKTATSLLALQHYGADFGEDSIAHFSSTGNYLTELMFQAKDMLLLVDEYVPSGNSREIGKTNMQADYVMRGVGNQAGRGRLGKDRKLEDPKQPRALALHTGEDMPPGQSLSARTVHVGFAPGSIDKTRLTRCQLDAKAGVYALAMSGYLRWLAKLPFDLTDYALSRTAELRRAFEAPGRHQRLATSLASLALGFEMFLDYAADVGAISLAQAEQLWQRMWRAFHSLAETQDAFQQSQDAVHDGLRLLRHALDHGKAYVKQIDSQPGETPVYPSSATHVGYVSVDSGGKPRMWYFIPEDMYALVDKLYAGQTRAAFPLTRETFFERLKQRGLLKAEAGRKHCRVRVDGKQPWFLCIPDKALNSTSEDETERPAERANIPERKSALSRMSVEPESDYAHSARVHVLAETTQAIL